MRVKSFVGVLYNSYATAPLHCQQSSSSIVQRSCEDHPYHLWTIGQGRRTKQRVDGWPVAVFLGTTYHTNLATFHQHMMIWRGHIDTAMLNLRSVRCVNHLEHSRAA